MCVYIPCTAGDIAKITLITSGLIAKRKGLWANVLFVTVGSAQQATRESKIYLYTVSIYIDSLNEYHLCLYIYVYMMCVCVCLNGVCR